MKTKQQWEKKFYNRFGNYGLYAKMGMGRIEDKFFDVLNFMRENREAIRKEAIEQCIELIRNPDCEEKKIHHAKCGCKTIEPLTKLLK